MSQSLSSTSDIPLNQSEDTADTQYTLSQSEWNGPQEMEFSCHFQAGPFLKKSIPLFSIPDSTFHIPPESAEYFL